MFALLRLLVSLISNWLKSRRRLEVENLYLRHQLNIALRGAPHGLRLRGGDRAFLVWMTRLGQTCSTCYAWFGRIRFFAGIAQDCGPAGVGSLAVDQAVPRLVPGCENSFGKLPGRT